MAWQEYEGNMVVVDRAIDRNIRVLLEPALFYGLTMVVGARTSRIAGAATGSGRTNAGENGNERDLHDHVCPPATP